VLGNLLRKRQLERELFEALAHYEQALTHEPTYARVHVAIAETWIVLSSWTSYVKPRVGFPNAKAAALQALAIDDSLGEAHSAIGFVSEVFDRDFAAAERSYQRALALNPNDALTRSRYSLFLNRSGREREAVHESERAYELDPLSIEHSIGLGMRLFADGRRDDGIAAMKRAAALDPIHFETWVHLAEAQVAMGSHDEAIQSAERGVELSRQAPHALHMLASISHRVGRRVEADAVLQRLEQSTQRNAYEIAMLRMSMGQIGEAVTWFLTACEERTPQMAFFRSLYARDVFKPLAGEPRTAEILRCLERDEQS
jgi:tetratricopeptide (TPR) repeat protein